MNCAWQQYLELLPGWLREMVDKTGAEDLEELRLRIDLPPELVFHEGRVQLNGRVKREDLEFCINIASSYSPWVSDTLRNGYITAKGGHRIGICGTAVVKNKEMCGIRNISSLCIRVARAFPGVSKNVADLSESVLIIGSPGCGKTTFLRDLIIQRALRNKHSISVVDEREELFPKNGDHFCFSPAFGVDVLSGCDKLTGINTVLRAMSPQIIAVDEITTESDCIALHRAGWCGVKLLATAHAASREELFKRPVYKPIIDTGLFDYLIILDGKKKWTCERMKK